MLLPHPTIFVDFKLIYIARVNEAELHFGSGKTGRHWLLFTPLSQIECLLYFHVEIYVSVEPCQLFLCPVHPSSSLSSLSC